MAATSFATDLDAYPRRLPRSGSTSTSRCLERQRGVHSHEFIEVISRQRELQAALFDAGWVRYGWPESLGGLGGDARHRGSMYDALVERGVPVPEPYYTLETLIPMLSVYAPDLAREHLDAPCCGATRRGVRASPSPTRAATSRRCARRRCATATTG